MPNIESTFDVNNLFDRLGISRLKLNYRFSSSIFGKTDSQIWYKEEVIKSNLNKKLSQFDSPMCVGSTFLFCFLANS